MKKINWGIIGLGNIAQSFSEGFFGLENSKLLAVSSSNDSKLKYFKNRYEISENYIFKNYEDLLKCKDVDIVYIALPNNLHYEWVDKCIEKNKKILVEKPAFLKLDHAEVIKEKILNKNLFFTEGYMYRYNPQIRKTLEIIKSNELGAVISMESSFCKNILTKKKFFFFEKNKKIDTNNRLFNKDLGGGCILDLGCYPTSFSLLIASMINGVNFRKFKLKNVKKEINFTGVDIDAEAELCFDDNFTSKIKSSFKNSSGSSTTIYCEKGNLLINNSWTGKTEVIKIINGKRELIKNKYEKNIYSYEINEISKNILEGKNEPFYPAVTIEETIVNTNILESWLNA